MNLLFKLIQGIERITTRASLFIAMCCLVILSLSCIYQVVARFILYESIAWSDTLATMMMTWAVFFGLPAAFREGAMISVDIIPSMVGKDKAWLVLLIAGLTLFLLIFCAWYGWAILPRVRFQTIAGLNISIMWSYLAIPVGMTLAALAVFTETIEVLRDGRSHDGQEIEV